MKTFFDLLEAATDEYLVLQRTADRTYFRFCNEQMAKDYIDMYGNIKDNSLFVCKVGEVIFQSKNWKG